LTETQSGNICSRINNLVTWLFSLSLRRCAFLLFRHLPQVDFFMSPQDFPVSQKSSVGGRGSSFAALLCGNARGLCLCLQWLYSNKKKKLAEVSVLRSCLVQ